MINAMCEIKYLNVNWDPGDVLVLETDGETNSWKYFCSTKEFQEYKKSISENVRVQIFKVMQRRTWSYQTSVNLSTMHCNDSEILGSFTDEKPVIDNYINVHKIDPEAEYAVTYVKTGKVKKMKGKDLM